MAEEPPTPFSERRNNSDAVKYTPIDPVGRHMSTDGDDETEDTSFPDEHGLQGHCEISSNSNSNSNHVVQNRRPWTMILLLGIALGLTSWMGNHAGGLRNFSRADNASLLEREEALRAKEAALAEREKALAADQQQQEQQQQQQQQQQHTVDSESESTSSDEESNQEIPTEEETISKEEEEIKEGTTESEKDTISAEEEEIKEEIPESEEETISKEETMGSEAEKEESMSFDNEAIENKEESASSKEERTESKGDKSISFDDEEEKSKIEEGATQNEVESSSFKDKSVESEEEPNAAKEEPMESKEASISEDEMTESEEETMASEEDEMAESEEEESAGVEEEASEIQEEEVEEESAESKDEIVTDEKSAAIEETIEEETAPSEEEESMEGEDDSSEEDPAEESSKEETEADRPLESWESEAWNKLTSNKRAQIENFRKNNALILNVNVPHHGGTGMCAVIGKGARSAPSLVCEHDHEGVMPDPPDCRVGNGTTHTPKDPPFCYSYEEMNTSQLPWLKNQTEPFIEAIHPYFQMIKWELDHPVGREKHDQGRTLESTDWENPRLVSAIVTRDPMARLLASDGFLGKEYPGYNTNELSRERWWDYAAYNDDRNTDNFFLRIVSTTHRHKRNETIQNHATEGISRSTEEMMDLFPTGIGQAQFERAKNMLDKFTFVLDIDCLTEGMAAMGKMLRMGTIPPQSIPHHPHTEPPRERIQYDDVYEYLRAKNEWDIKLYEYSKTISIVHCPPKSTQTAEFEEGASEEEPIIAEYPTATFETEAPTAFTAPPTTFNNII